MRFKKAPVKKSGYCFAWRFAFMPTRVEGVVIWFEGYYLKYYKYFDEHGVHRGNYGVPSSELLPESPEVQAYLLANSPLSKALTED